MSMTRKMETPLSEVQGCCIPEGEGRGSPSRPWGQGDADLRELSPPKRTWSEKSTEPLAGAKKAERLGCRSP